MIVRSGCSRRRTPCLPGTRRSAPRCPISARVEVRGPSSSRAVRAAAGRLSLSWSLTGPGLLNCIPPDPARLSIRTGPRAASRRPGVARPRAGSAAALDRSGPRQALPSGRRVVALGRSTGRRTLPPNSRAALPRPARPSRRPAARRAHRQFRKVAAGSTSEPAHIQKFDLLPVLPQPESTGFEPGFTAAVRVTR